LWKSGAGWSRNIFSVDKKPSFLLLLQLYFQTGKFTGVNNAELWIKKRFYFNIGTTEFFLPDSDKDYRNGTVHFSNGTGTNI
jgi:hypothetical protein